MGLRGGGEAGSCSPWMGSQGRAGLPTQIGAPVALSAPGPPASSLRTYRRKFPAFLSSRPPASHIPTTLTMPGPSFPCSLWPPPGSCNPTFRDTSCRSWDSWGSPGRIGAATHHPALNLPESAHARDPMGWGHMSHVHSLPEQQGKEPERTAGSYFAGVACSAHLFLLWPPFRGPRGTPGRCWAGVVWAVSQAGMAHEDWGGI